MSLPPYAIVEQMGHRRVVGAVEEVELAGQRFVRVTTCSAPPIVTLVHPQSLYALTACTEAHARREARQDYSPLRELDAPDLDALGDDEADDAHAQLARDHARLRAAAEALWDHYRPGYDALEPALRTLVGELTGALCEGGGDAPAADVDEAPPSAVPSVGPCAHCGVPCVRADYCFGCGAFYCDDHGGPPDLIGPHEAAEHLASRDP